MTQIQTNIHNIYIFGKMRKLGKINVFLCQIRKQTGNVLNLAKVVFCVRFLEISKIYGKSPKQYMILAQQQDGAYARKTHK
jgi:hypothetical protein